MIAHDRSCCTPEKRVNSIPLIIFRRLRYTTLMIGMLPIALAIEALGKTLADSSKRRGHFQSVGEMAAWALAFAALGASRPAALKILDDEQFWASKNKTISKNVGIALGIIAGKIKIAPPM